MSSGGLCLLLTETALSGYAVQYSFVLLRILTADTREVS